MRSRTSLLAVSFVLSFGCSSTPPAENNCVDGDGDGYGANCSAGPDCDDSNPAVHPGAAEVCNGSDDNCDGVVDEGCAVPPDAGPTPPDAGEPPDAGTACNPSDPPVPCGHAGSSCVQTCSGGVLGPCQPPSGPINIQTDPSNCGQCGNVCPTPLHAAARCLQGQCKRTPCAAGWYDFDRDTTYGCEVSCSGLVCHDPAGNIINLTAEPLPETGLTWQAVASGSSFGGQVQTSAAYTNMGILGEPTPPAANGKVESSNANHRNFGGFTSMLRKQ